MNNRRVGSFFMFFNGGPNLGHPGTGGIHNGAAFIVKQLHFLNTGTKGWQDDDIILAHHGEVFLTIGLHRNKLYFHIPQVLVD